MVEQKQLLVTVALANHSSWLVQCRVVMVTAELSWLLASCHGYWRVVMVTTELAWLLPSCHVFIIQNHSSPFILKVLIVSSSFLVVVQTYLFNLSTTEYFSVKKEF